VAVVALLVIATIWAVVGFWPEESESASAPVPARVSVNFITHPFEATISLDGSRLMQPGGQPYTTPCTVPDLETKPHRVVFHHPQRGELDAGEFDFATAREIVASWD
jgi:hypothetical protein